MIIAVEFSEDAFPSSAAHKKFFSMSSERVAHAVFMAAVSLAGSVGNTVTLLAIAFHRPLRNVTGAFMANLAVADVLQCVFGIPFIIAATLQDEWIVGHELCVITGTTNSLFCITSMLTLSAISFDRYLAVVHPLRYGDLLRDERVRLAILFIWGQSLLFALLPVFGWSRYAYLPYEFICTVQWEHDLPYTFTVVGFCFVVPAVLTTVFHCRILSAGCLQARVHTAVTLGELRDVPSNTDESAPTGTDGQGGMELVPHPKICEWVAGQTVGVDTPRQTQNAQIKRRKELKVGLMVLLVTGVFLFCWLPHIVGIFCLVFTQGSCPWSPRYFAVTTNLAMLNSACNPVIYSMTNRNYRRAFMKMFCRCFKAARAIAPHTSVN